MGDLFSRANRKWRYGQGPDCDMLSQIDQLLAAAGSSKSDILSVTLWLSDMADFEQMNSVWDNWIDPKNPPDEHAVRQSWPHPTIWSRLS